MTPDNFQVRPHRKAVESLSTPAVWRQPLTPEVAEATREVSGLPSTSAPKDNEDARYFDLLVLRRQLAQLDGDVGVADKIREKVQQIAGGLLSKLAIPDVAKQRVLLEQAASDEWWVAVTLEMLELLRLRVRGLVQFLIVDELTRNGVMSPGRLFESPYTDHAPTGPDYVFRDAQVEVLVSALDNIKRTAVPEEVA